MGGWGMGGRHGQWALRRLRWWAGRRASEGPPPQCPTTRPIHPSIHENTRYAPKVPEGDLQAAQDLGAGHVVGHDALLALFHLLAHAGEPALAAHLAGDLGLDGLGLLLARHALAPCRRHPFWGGGGAVRVVWVWRGWVGLGGHSIIASHRRTTDWMAREGARGRVLEGNQNAPPRGRLAVRWDTCVPTPCRPGWWAGRRGRGACLTQRGGVSLSWVGLGGHVRVRQKRRGGVVLGRRALRGV